jgi:very-short-patch-repair endonuclease
MTCFGLSGVLHTMQGLKFGSTNDWVRIALPRFSRKRTDGPSASAARTTHYNAPELMRPTGGEPLGAAIPGWPANVPLPVDPEWKSQYAASVRRLVRDGVDSPLAHLFVHATVTPPAEAEGADRARSATEGFLFRRLETLSVTAGKFRLNSELPISFDGWGRMEVDLLCEQSRIAIELDGGQHLGDPDAYRRDRRKDALFQENGYLVLRFLAEDVGKNLDQVLDTILRALSHQGVRG